MNFFLTNENCLVRLDPIPYFPLPTDTYKAVVVSLIRKPFDEFNSPQTVLGCY